MAVPKKKTKRSKILGRERRAATLDLAWVIPIASQVGQNAPLFARALAALLREIIKNPDLPSHSMAKLKRHSSGLSLIANLTGHDLIEEFERTFHSFAKHFSDSDAELLDSDQFVRGVLEPAIRTTAILVEKNPHLVYLLLNLELLREEFGSAGKRLAEVFKFIPALSQQAAAMFPAIREQCYSALFQLSSEDREELGRFSDQLMRSLFNQFALPRLASMLENDSKGKVIVPFLDDMLQLIPPEASLNALVATICTPRDQLTPSKFMSIAVRELGGLYLKTAQVLAEMCPPNLARELRSSQDAASGVFPSVERSFAHLMNVLSQDEIKQQWADYLVLPREPIPHFAAASVGAIYELELNEAGRKKWGVNTLLVKIQRPGLHELLEIQAAHLSHIARKIEMQITQDETLVPQLRTELKGMCDALLRGITQYFRQCSAELDFRREQENAEIVREAIPQEARVAVPRYFQTSSKYLFMERMPGGKITRSVQTKYLERREIADRLIATYLLLLFDKGIVWADPHPGNILLDDSTLTVSMIDLNPCFVWDQQTRNNFKAMLYRLMLRDIGGVMETLYGLASNPENLHSNRLYDELSALMKTDEYSHGTVHFMTDFIRVLAENSIDLRIEVQAALRGLTQVAITATSISARNAFALQLRKYFGLKDILSTIFEVGPLRVFRVSTAIVFQHIQRSPEIEIGPTLDERDLRTLSKRLHELKKAGVCEIRFRRISPEEHANLRQTADGVSLITSSDLKLIILEKVRPARVKYLIELPSSSWLRDRQEFVKLTTLARNLAIVECLEQLRRKSLDDYWRTVEAWSKPVHVQTVNEVKLIGEVKIAARRLFQLRFSSLWDNPLSGLGWNTRLLWRMFLSLELRKEFAEQKFIAVAAKTKAHLPIAALAVGTVHRLRILIWEALVRMTRWRLLKRKFSMSLLPISIDKLESIVLHNLGRPSPEFRTPRRSPRDASR
jgi:predicted unusual protein kinase regulating ubiquinone biosynthesis (AarF/ABC1/UbiB family)